MWANAIKSENTEKACPTFSPEKGLLVAIFLRAAWDLRSENHNIRAGAWNWLESNDNDCFSFAWILTELDCETNRLPEIRRLARQLIAYTEEEIRIADLRNTFRGHRGRGDASRHTAVFSTEPAEVGTNEEL